jgi:hypothetical protein
MNIVIIDYNHRNGAGKFAHQGVAMIVLPHEVFLGEYNSCTNLSGDMHTHHRTSHGA